MMEPTQQITKIEEDILRLIEQLNRPITFRDLMIRLPDCGAQNVWDTLRRLQKATIIELVKMSNRKTGWRIQHWVVNGGYEGLNHRQMVEAFYIRKTTSTMSNW